MSKSRKKRGRQEAESSQERWLVSYADFITLMFAFFVVLYATSERNLEKTKNFEKSIKKFLAQVPAGGTGESRKSVGQEVKKSSPIRPPLPTFKTSSEAAKQIISTIEGYLETYVKKSERQKYLIDLSHDILGIRLSLDASQIFSPDSVLFKKSAISFMDKISNLVLEIKDPVIIESHTDKKQTRPAPILNDWNLSSLRSSSVVQYMIKIHQVDPQRLAAMGHGSERPLFSSSDIENKAKNQRLEILIITEESPF